MTDAVVGGKGGGLAQPDKWDGEQSTWTEWSFDMMNWCRRHDLNAPKYMRITLDMTDDMTRIHIYS